MAARAPATATDLPHVPVLIAALLRLAAPVRGLWLDGTLGAGGYARALLAAVEAWWIAGDFRADRMACLGQLDQEVAARR